MLAALFASTGTIMLTAGDEFGRTQLGNNNAYCQENALSWLAWSDRDSGLEDFVARLSAARAENGTAFAQRSPTLGWLSLEGEMTASLWDDPLGPGFELIVGDRSLIVDRRRPA